MPTGPVAQYQSIYYTNNHWASVDSVYMFIYELAKYNEFNHMILLMDMALVHTAEALRTKLAAELGM
eukprot:6436309-Amphidinium_carterae.1